MEQPLFNPDLARMRTANVPLADTRKVITGPADLATRSLLADVREAQQEREAAEQRGATVSAKVAELVRNGMTYNEAFDTCRKLMPDTFKAMKDPMRK